MRCNHVGVDFRADNQYETYAELSKLAGFNVEDEVKKYCEVPNENDLPDVLYVEDGTLYSAYGDTDIESITIPNNVTRIGDKTFWDFISLTTIKIPNSVTSIGNYAFRNCTSLKNITIPDSVTEIGFYAFSSCHKLTVFTDNEYVKKYCDNYDIKYAPLSEYHKS